MPRWLTALTLLALALLLGACASRPTRDGPGARVPAGLEQVPDAEPRIEPLRAGGPNKPYDVFGQRYVPLTGDQPLQDSGLASWYGAKFHGLPTSSGEPYDMYAMTAAHKTMPIPSYARVRNPANGREVVVRINDRGPFASGRVIDLSYTAALKLGVLRGVTPVEVQRLTFADIRAGAWRQPAGPLPAALPPAPVVAAVPAAVAAAVPAAAAAPAIPAIPAVPLSVPPAVVPALADPAALLAGDDLLTGDDPIAAGGFWLQLAALRQRDGALQLQRRALAVGTTPLPGVAVFDEAGWFRVQAGPFASRGDAEAAAARLRLSGLLSGPPLVVERQPR